MKLLNEHKGIILVFIAMVLFVIWWSGQVEKHDKEMSAIKNAQVENWSGTNENN